MGIYDNINRPKTPRVFMTATLVKWAVGAALVGFLLGMAVGVANANPGTTRNYATQTISFYLDEGEMVSVTECPEGWTWEAYVDVPDLDNLPALVPILIMEGDCGRE